MEGNAVTQFAIPSLNSVHQATINTTPHALKSHSHYTIGLDSRNTPMYSHFSKSKKGVTRINRLSRKGITQIQIDLKKKWQFRRLYKRADSCERADELVRQQISFCLLKFSASLSGRSRGARTGTQFLFLSRCVSSVFECFYLCLCFSV